MRRATAQALAPGTRWIDHDPGACARALERLACWALQFTPSVAFAPPPLAARPTRELAASAPLTGAADAGLLLEVEPSLKLFGGQDALLQRLADELQQLGYQAVAGIAPTAGAAWLLPGRPPTNEPTGCALRRQGPAQRRWPRLARSVTASPARFARRPADRPPHRSQGAPVGAADHGRPPAGPPVRSAPCRPGTALWQEPVARDRSRAGRTAAADPLFPRPEHFSSRLELLADVETTEPLLFATHRMLLELTGWLRARQAGLRSFDLVAEHHDPPQTSVSVRLTHPSREPARLGGLLRERLNLLSLRAPVQALRLQCHDIHDLPLASGELFANPASAHENLGRLLERLQVRLGREQVQRLLLAEDHRPEAAYRVCVIESLDQIGRPAPALPANRSSASGGIAPGPLSGALVPLAALNPVAGQASPGGQLPRPLWLLREPRPLSERNNRPWLQGTLTVLAGPERIETGWWDNHLVQRDYFVAEDDDHHLYWIYRERQPRADSGWFVHGRFG
ncbi:MAG: DNA polymerase Y family protein [Burkholderiaceae bacterium]